MEVRIGRYLEKAFKVRKLKKKKEMARIGELERLLSQAQAYDLSSNSFCRPTALPCTGVNHTAHSVSLHGPFVCNLGNSPPNTISILCPASSRGTDPHFSLLLPWSAYGPIRTESRHELDLDRATKKFMRRRSLYDIPLSHDGIAI